MPGVYVRGVKDQRDQTGGGLRLTVHESFDQPGLAPGFTLQIQSLHQGGAHHGEKIAGFQDEIGDLGRCVTVRAEQWG